MKIRISIFLICISTVAAFAGFGEKLPIRWGRISPSEFSIRPLGSDSAAPAIVLCDFGFIDISNRTFYRRHTRIRIMNEEGLRYASVEIPYQSKNKHDVFYDLKARTLVMENGKIIAYKVLPEQIEDIRINDRWSKKKFTFPQARPGAIVEFQYTLASLDFESLQTWYFQREIPTLWSEIRFQVPEPYEYLVTFENNRPLTADEDMNYVKRLQWMYDTGSHRRRAELARSKDLLYATDENRFKVWVMNNWKKKIIMTNLPGLSTVPGSQAVTDFYPRVRFTLFESSGNLPRSFRPLILTTRDDYESRGERALMQDWTVMPGYIHYRLKTWGQFNANLLEQERFGKYLIMNGGGNRLIDSISGGNHDQVARLAAVNHYIRSTFKWNGEFSMVAGQDFNDFIRKGTGSSAEINLLLINLLQHAGIKACPLLVRTADLGMPEKRYPVKNQFNHVIAMAEINGKQVLLDATAVNADLNKLDRKYIGAQGWMVRKDNPGWIEIFSLNGKKGQDAAPLFYL
jgi:hypothetical protein